MSKENRGRPKGAKNKVYKPRKVSVGTFYISEYMLERLGVGDTIPTRIESGKEVARMAMREALVACGALPRPTSVGSKMSGGQ